MTYDKKKLLFYSYKNYKNSGRNYKIGFALLSENKWIRMDNKLKMKFSKSNFDIEMQEYASIVNYKDDYLMFYNGNNYGEQGIGLARLIRK